MTGLQLTVRDTLPGDIKPARRSAPYTDLWEAIQGLGAGKSLLVRTPDVARVRGAVCVRLARARRTDSVSFAHVVTRAIDEESFLVARLEAAEDTPERVVPGKGKKAKAK